MYLSKKIASFLILSTGLVSCKSGSDKVEKTHTYFDITGYFSRQTTSLQKRDPLIIKTIVDNGNTETRKVKIADWPTELALFSASDINKASWKNSYSIVKTPLSVSYSAKDSNLKTQRIFIRFDEKNQVKQISISNRSDNILYKDAEQLDFYPDSAYIIHKDQQIRVLGKHKYMIDAAISR